jgi:hypothetical protein
MRRGPRERFVSSLEFRSGMDPRLRGDDEVAVAAGQCRRVANVGTGAEPELVAPAKAGAQWRREPPFGVLPMAFCRERRSGMDSRFRGNDGSNASMESDFVVPGRSKDGDVMSDGIPGQRVRNK